MQKKLQSKRKLEMVLTETGQSEEVLEMTP
jgi:hypothetical protein